MAEMDALDRRVVTALLGYAGEVPDAVDAVAVAHRVAREHPRGRGRRIGWRPTTLPRLAWVLVLLAGLLGVLVGGVLMAGSQQNGRLPAVVPPLPLTAFTCPEGSQPDVPGPTEQALPPGLRPSVAFDQGAGRLVAVSDDPPEIWTFDVCANIWQRSDLALPYAPRWITYDPRLGVTHMIADRMLRYDARADTLSIGSPPPGALGELGHSAYRTATGELLVLELQTRALWTYDPAADTWHRVAQRGDIPDPYHSRWLFAYDPGVDRFVFYLRRHTTAETYEFDPNTATWAPQQIGTAALIFAMGDLASEAEIAFDETAGRVAVSSSGEIIEYDATEHAWHRFADAGFENPMLDRFDASLAFDAVNDRILLVGGWRDGRALVDVAAFDPVDQRWMELMSTGAGTGSAGESPLP